MRHLLLPLAALATVGPPRDARAWTSGHLLNSDGCHEPMTAEAFAAVRATPATAPPIAPTRDEAALIEDVQFRPPAGVKHDLAAMTLLLGATGPYVAVSVLGLDIDLGNSLRIVFEPSEISLPFPVISPPPLYYEQFRVMIGLQYGS